MFIVYCWLTSSFICKDTLGRMGIKKKEKKKYAAKSFFPLKKIVWREIVHRLLGMCEEERLSSIKKKVERS